jgi:drug/metabolite transporter (DMT)-like permease
VVAKGFRGRLGKLAYQHQGVQCVQTWIVVMPGLFVLLWSTGFIGARFGLPYAEPFTFLTIRMAIATVLLVSVALFARSPWPRGWRQAGHIAVAGLLVHAGYLGGVFYAISVGMPAGIAALIVGLQPLLTAAMAGWLLGERVLARQWAGLVIGLIGITMVLSDRFGTGQASLEGVLATLTALLAITFGTLYQKRRCANMDLLTGGVVQFAATGIAMLALAVIFETCRVSWTAEFVFALSWLVLVLSVGAVGLLYTLIRRGAASKVASLFYLVPPVVALLSFLLFDERLDRFDLLGMGVVVLGVSLATQVAVKTR